MKKIRILDCTLRDGGRIINCAFKNQEIKNISEELADAGIDIIEMGFLRDGRDVEYLGDTTFFTEVHQITPFLDNKKQNVLYTAFIDYGMCNIDNLDSYDGTSIDAIRLGFTKKNYDENKEDIIRWAKIIKERGYKLFIQGVNSLNYNDAELLEVIEMVNEIHPYSFGIVDTYGAMYVDDVDRLYGLIDHNMLSDICINFHSHNNYQLSFSLAQEIVKLSANGTRNVIIDGTLSGMGKVAGNLNTELFVDFMLRKLHYDYDLDVIFDCIDDYIYKYTIEHKWGYSVPALMAGVYKSHPNNVIYLTEKFRLHTKDIGYLLSMIEPELRQRYDYSNIKKVYEEYTGENIDDRKTIDEINKLWGGKDVLILVPGNTISTDERQINSFIDNNDVIVISVNFVSAYKDSWAFYGNKKRYENDIRVDKSQHVVVTSNIEPRGKNSLRVNYHTLLNNTHELSDNSTMMLLNMVRKLNTQKIFIAGFDGFDKNKRNNFVDESFQEQRHNAASYDKVNREISVMLDEFAESISEKCVITFITPSYYQKYVTNREIIFKEKITV